MGRAINTMVFGSPNTCEEAADWLDSLSTQTSNASDAVYTAESDLDSGAWVGPAFDAYHDSRHGTGGGFDTVSGAASDWSSALRDFASGLRTVQQKMDGILDQARRGGLSVDGPFALAPEFHIQAPEKPANVRMLPGEPGSPAADAYNAYVDRVDAFNVKVDAFNEKIALYNDLQEQAFDQRKDENQLHVDLAGALVLPDGIDSISVALTGAGWGQTFIANVDGVYHDEMGKLNDLNANQSALLKFNQGTAVSEAEMGRVSSVMATQNQQAARVKAAHQWHRFIDWMPDEARNALRKGPSSIPKLPGGAASALKGFSYAGTVITGLAQARGAYKGEQTWSQAIKKTGVGLAESAAMSRALSGSLRGSRAGVPGAVIGGIAGSLIPSMAEDNHPLKEMADEQRIHDRYFAPVDEIDRLEYFDDPRNR